MVGPYAGGPSPNGAGYQQQQRYDSAIPSASPYDAPRGAGAANMNMNSRGANYAPSPADNYGPGRPDQYSGMQQPRQQSAGPGYQLVDPQTRSLPPPPQAYGGGNGPLPSPANRPSEDRQKVASNGQQRRPSGSRICGKCGEPLQGQFVRALDNTFHLDCFTCHECGKVVASKFFPVPDEGPDQYPLCETDYFRRLDLLCFACGGALRGSYITALDRKYHIEHFTCSVCPTIFGAQDSYYEHEGDVYCHYHYSTRFAQRCHGCQNAILKQFVEIFRNGQNQHWHPECYMIHKYWNVRLSNASKDRENAAIEPPRSEDNPQDVVRNSVRDEEERVEEKVLWIWRTLSTFEERSATCISDMLLHVSNGVYFDGIMAAKRFIVHVDVFFKCGDDLDHMLAQQTGKGLSYSREAKLLCKKVVSFFSLLSESSDAGVRRLGVTQELLSLVTGLAHYLKLLIRICLQGALKLERETGNGDGLNRFLNQINSLDERLAQNESSDPIAESLPYVRGESDHCPICTKPVEDKCARFEQRCFHLACMRCKSCGRELGDNVNEAWFSPSTGNVLCYEHKMQFADGMQGFVFITRLQQYVHLLLVAHARLLATLRSQGALPHTSDDPNLARYDSSQGHRLGGADPLSPPMLNSDSRSKSFAGQTAATEVARNNRVSASYEQTLGDIRRLRSTRMERHLSTTQKRARTSRVIEGPGGVQAGPTDDGPRNHRESLQQGDDASLAFGAQSIALDDIPRLVAAEQAREQRPNASKYARGNLMREQQPRLLNGHRRDISGGNELDRAIAEGGSRSRRYFSELSPLEYFFVRHIAVLNMEPLLDGHFNQQELLNLIEAPEKAGTTFWSRFGKALKGGGNKNDTKKKGVFGKPLEQIVDRDGAESTDGVGPGALRIPALVDCAVAAMRNMDMSVEGVFRKNGNIRRLRELSEEIDTKGCEAVDLTKETPVQVAALLKKFLRELADPVMSTKLHRLWITAAKIPDEEKQRRVLHLTCCLLPKVNRDTMEILFNFMNWVASFHTVDEETGSKMDIHNLATVIAPNILYSDIKSPDMDSSFLAIEAVAGMIECNEMFSEIPEDITSLLNDPIFEKEADVTTKEILKRYGDMSKASKVAISQAPQQHGNGSREGRGAIQHVNDEYAGNWPMESSVRHVGNNNVNAMGGATPPQAQHFVPREQQDVGSPNRQSQFRGSGVPAGAGRGPAAIAGRTQMRAQAAQVHHVDGADVPSTTIGGKKEKRFSFLAMLFPRRKQVIENVDAGLYRAEAACAVA